jgi:hypothetical protein
LMVHSARSQNWKHYFACILELYWEVVASYHQHCLSLCSYRWQSATLTFLIN